MAMGLLRKGSDRSIIEDKKKTSKDSKGAATTENQQHIRIKFLGSTSRSRIFDSDTEPPTSSSESESSNRTGRTGKPPLPTHSGDEHMSDVKTTKRTNRRKKKKSSPKQVEPAEEEYYENPFAKSENSKLGPDMSILAEGMNLDENTKTMLAYFDARTIEDFALMADVDLCDMIDSARSMNRTLPPLQIRKVEVLREWVRELTKSEGGRQQQKIPKDWKLRFKKDVPKLKAILKARGDSLAMFSFYGYVQSWRSLFCGMPQ